MVWSYPDISLEDLLKIIQNFIDMLILASGYQSTGRLAHWNSHNIKKFFEWAIFLENVSKGLRSSGDYQDSVEELDAALSVLKSNPCFPQGLRHLSCDTLGRARELLLEHLIQALPLRESHLKAIVAASVEMDFSKLGRVDSDCLHAYLKKLMETPAKGLNLSAGPSSKHESGLDSNFSLSAIQQLERRQLAVTCSFALETGLENLWRNVEKRLHAGLGSSSNSEPTKHPPCLITEEPPVKSIIWNCWRSRSLAYMLDKRTIRLVSGASLIFSSPEGQWIEMFERLNDSVQSDDGLPETIELLLFGCIADRWNTFVEKLMSVSYESITISRIYDEVFNLTGGNPANALINHKEKNIVNYLEKLLCSQLNHLWKLSPVLAAVAIPSWSQLFRSYLHELGVQFREYSLATRHCSCMADKVQHREYLMNLQL